MVTKTPYGLHVIESCLSCPMLKDSFFCNLSQRAVESLNAISSPATYPKGAILFVEEQEPRGVFVICSGRVKLSANSIGGKSLILRMVEAGEVIGLPGTITGRPYGLTAEAHEPVQASFIRREDFLHFLREHGEVAVRVAELLCRIYQATFQEVKYLGLSGSAIQKLAKFILNLPDSRTPGNGPVRAALTLTHEEIAEMIGSSRETVTRLFASLKKKQLVEVHGSMLVVKDKPGLQKLVEG